MNEHEYLTDQELVTAFLAATSRLSDMEAAEAAGVTHTTVGRWKKGHGDGWKELQAGTRRSLLDYLAQMRTKPNGGVESMRAEAEREAAAAEAAKREAPSLSHLDWLPRLIDKVLDDRTLTASEKRSLIAELNATGMRYWAVAAEWASGQRGIAMTEAEVSSGRRADANAQEARSASERALALHREEEEERPRGKVPEERKRRMHQKLTARGKGDQGKRAAGDG